MRSFILYPRNGAPHWVEADNYEFVNGTLEFWADGKMIRSVEASALLAIVEDKLQPTGDGMPSEL